MLGDDVSDASRDFFASGDVEKFIRAVGVRLRSEYARYEKLRRGKFVAEQ